MDRWSNLFTITDFTKDTSVINYSPTITLLLFLGGTPQPQSEIPTKIFLPIFICHEPFTVVFLTGTYWQLLHEDGDYWKFDKCPASETIIYVILVSIVSLSVVLNFFSSIVLLVTDLKYKKRYILLLNLNITTLIFDSSLVNLLIDKGTSILRFWCIFISTYFMASSCFFLFSLASISVDCIIAVYFPFKYHEMFTAPAILVSNFLFALFLSVFYIFIPLYFLSAIDDGLLQAHCSTELIWMNFYYCNFFLTLLLIGAICFMQVIIFVGVILALIRHKKLSRSQDAIGVKMLKLSIRLGSLLCLNILCSLPLMLEGINLFPDFWIPKVYMFTLGQTVGVWNVLVYFVADENIRRVILCRKKRNQPKIGPEDNSRREEENQRWTSSSVVWSFFCFYATWTHELCATLCGEGC